MFSTPVGLTTVLHLYFLMAEPSAHFVEQAGAVPLVD
jgi:hypothetical protein